MVVCKMIIWKKDYPYYEFDDGWTVWMSCFEHGFLVFSREVIRFR